MAISVGQIGKLFRSSRTLAFLAWGLIAINLLIWLLLQFGDEWAPATFVMFGPRWVFAVLPVLLLPATWWSRQSIVPLLLALGIAVGPIMGMHIPWSAASNPGREQIRVLSCNIHYGKVQAHILDALVLEQGPDILAFQEGYRVEPSPELKLPGWHIHKSGTFFLASRFPIDKTETLGGNSTGDQGAAIHYQLRGDEGPLHLISLHLASPRDELKKAAMSGPDGLDEVRSNTELRDRQSAYLSERIASIPGRVLIVGDFNTPPESRLFQSAWSDYTDAFAVAGWGWGYTFKNRLTQVRIDHILVGGGGKVSRAWVERNLGSPHRPVVADVSWPDRPLDEK